MDIGTAKVCPENTKIPHHLLNIVPVTHSYGAGEFRKGALKAIEVIIVANSHVINYDNLCSPFYCVEELQLL